MAKLRRPKILLPLDDSAPVEPDAQPAPEGETMPQPQPAGTRVITGAIEGAKCASCGGPTLGCRIYWRVGAPRGKRAWHVECPAPVEDGMIVHDPTENAEPLPEGGPYTPHAATPGSIDAIIDGRIAEALGSFKPSEAVTADTAKALVESAIERSMDRESIRKLVAELTAPVTVKHEFVIPGHKPVTIEGAHYLVPRVAALVKAGFHVYLYGGAGGGKTTAAMQIAEALGRRWEMDTLDPTTFKSMVQGFMDANGKMVQTPFLRSFAEGKDNGIYIAEELDCAPAGVQNLFNTALANGHAPTARGTIPKGAKFAFLGTGNTPMRPTAEFPERKPGGAAFKDRLYFVYWPQDESIENRACGLPVENPPERVGTTPTFQEWVLWVKKIRAHVAGTPLAAHTGQRASLMGEKLIALGETAAEMADGLVFKGADPALKAKILAACPLPG